jgi:hypothetical protein
MNRYDSSARFVAPTLDGDPEFGRYGTTPEPTVGGRMAVAVGHLLTALAVVACAGAAMLTIYALWYLFTGTSVAIVVALFLGCAFLWAFGLVAVWRTTLDEWAIRHDQRMWHALQHRLRNAQQELAAAQERDATARDTIASLRAELAEARGALFKATFTGTTARHIPAVPPPDDPVLADAKRLATQYYEHGQRISRRRATSVLGWPESRYQQAWHVLKLAGVVGDREWRDLTLDEALALLSPPEEIA